MKLYTKYHGVKEYEECDVINFEKGLPGFVDLKKFILFPVEENEVFSVLHSVENADIGLVVASPFYVDKNYEFKLEDDKIYELSIEKESDVLVVNTICLNSDIKKLTMNLKAPIIINIKEKKGEQLILDSDIYLVKHPLFKEE